MDYAGYVLAGYGVVFATLAGYAAWVLRRGREASRRVPAERRRWSDS